MDKNMGRAIVGLMVIGLAYNMLAGGAINVGRATEIAADYMARLTIAIIGVEPTDGGE